MPSCVSKWSISWQVWLQCIELNNLDTNVVSSEAYDGDIKDWNEIAKKIPGRNNKDCRKRFMNEVTGGLKKVRPKSQVS